MKKYLIILILTLIGFSSALYLSIPAYQYWNGENSEALQAMPCDLSEKLSCSGILKNPRAIIFEIPTSFGKKEATRCGNFKCISAERPPFKVAFPMIALVVYPILAILAIVGYFSRKILLAKIITIMAIGGMAFNGYVISQEIIV